MSDRSSPIYQAIHPLKLIANGIVEKAFLKKLHAKIPRHINVIVVTEAGFKRPWVQAVGQLNWDCLGRGRADKEP